MVILFVFGIFWVGCSRYLASLPARRYSVSVGFNRKKPFAIWWCALLLLNGCAILSHPQDTESSPINNDPVAMFPHSDTAPYWISAQNNIIAQWHPSFYAKYSGPNSFGPDAEYAVSNAFTLFTGYRTHNTEFFFDLESASGGGLSDALGLAGFTNVDVVRSPDLGGTPYVARAMIRQIIPLSSQKIEAQRGPLGLATE